MHGRDEHARLEKIDARTRATRIAALNDALRQHRTGGRLAITAGVLALGEHVVPAIMDAVSGFSAFDDDNDPYAEHDFGSFGHAGERLFWKIDYYDRSLRFGSPEPADPDVTTRVLTIMLANEW